MDSREPQGVSTQAMFLQRFRREIGPTTERNTTMRVIVMVKATEDS